MYKIVHIVEMSITKFDVLDSIDRIARNTDAVSHKPRGARHCEIWRRIKNERTNEVLNDDYLRTVSHRYLRNLVKDGLVKKERIYYYLTDDGRRCYISNLVKINKHYQWDEKIKEKTVASFAFPPRGDLIGERRNDEKNLNKVVDALLDKVNDSDIPDDTIIYIRKRKK